MDTTAIDLYCERTSPAFWAEPVNALSNLSFIVAAIALVLLLRRTDVRVGAAAVVLTVNVAAIGVGSFLFHTLANRWTLLADVLPIFLYQLVFLAVYLRTISGLALTRVAALLGLFVLVSYGCTRLPPQWLNGSLAYGGALLFISALALHHHARQRREPWGLLLAVLMFVISIGFRSADLALCTHLALGTHFLWHLLNGLVLYLTTRAYVLNQPCAR